MKHSDGHEEVTRVNTQRAVMNQEGRTNHSYSSISQSNTTMRGNTNHATKKHTYEEGIRNHDHGRTNAKDTVNTYIDNTAHGSGVANTNATNSAKCTMNTKDTNDHAQTTSGSYQLTC